MTDRVRPIQAGLQIFQPISSVANSFMGGEQQDGSWWACGAGLECVYADAAIVQGANETYAQDQIARPSPFNGVIIDDTSPFFVVGEVAASVVGMDVWKIGRTTGLTWGDVQATCVHRNPDGVQPQRVYLCQDGASYAADGGDSGSPVFTDDSGFDVSMVGIHSNHAGIRRYFSPMAQVRLAYPSLPPLLH